MPRKFAEQHKTKIEWIANITLWISGAMIAISPEMAREAWWLFATLTVGQVLWGISAILIKNWALLASSVFFSILNMYGIYVRIGVN